MASHEREQEAEKKRETKETRLKKKKDELSKRLISFHKKTKRPARESIVDIADKSVSRVLTIQHATVEI